MTGRKPRRGVTKVDQAETMTATCQVCEERFTTSTQASAHARRYGHEVAVSGLTRFTWQPEPGPVLDLEPDRKPTPAGELVASEVVETALGLSAIYYRRARVVDA